MSRHFSEIKGHLGMVYGHEETGAKWFEELFYKEQDGKGEELLTVKEAEDDVSLLKGSSLIVIPTPLRDEKDNGREEARELKKLVQGTDASVLTVFNYRTPEDLELSRKSQFVDELSKAFGISKITGIPASDDIRVPFGKIVYGEVEIGDRFLGLLPDVRKFNFFIDELVLKKGKYTHEGLINTGNLTFLKGLPIKEDSEMYLKVNSFGLKEVVASRRITADIDEVMLHQEGRNEARYGSLREAGMKPEHYKQIAAVLDDLANQKTGGYLPIEGSRGLFCAFAFGVLIPENYGMLLRMLNKSVLHEEESSRKKSEEKLHAISQLPVEYL